MAMTLHHFTFSADDFAALPQKERIFFIRLAQARNDIRHIHHLTIAAVQAVSAHRGLEQKIALHQLLFCVREQYAALYETWIIIKKDWCSPDGLHRTHSGKISTKAKAALAALEKYFGGRNLVKTVRDKVSSHYDPEVVAAAVEKTHQEQYFVASESRRNIFYLAAEDLRNFAILCLVDTSLLQGHVMDKRKVGAAVRTLYDDALHIFDLLADFSDSALLSLANARTTQLKLRRFPSRTRNRSSQ
jgi:hypothetical protein